MRSNRRTTQDRRFRTRVNYQIRVPEVRVVDEEGEQLGVMPTDQAINLAEERGLDLVEVAPTSRPPVCRIIDYGKFKYEKSKRERQSKKKQHTTSVKEIKLRPKTEEHDYQFKKRHAEEFLEKHHKVKFTVIFRGRERDHKEFGVRVLNRLRDELKVLGQVESPPQFEGRFMTMVMAPYSKSNQPKPAKEPTPAPRAKAAEADGNASNDAKDTKPTQAEASEKTDESE